MSEARNALTLNASEVGSAAPPPTSEVAIVGMPRRIKLGGARAAGAASLPVPAAADDVVRVEYENGLVVWTRADDLLRERGQRTVGRGDAGATWTIDPAPRAGLTQRQGVAGERGSERGALGLGIKVLELFGIDLKKKSAALLGKAFEERQLKGHSPGFYRCPLDPGQALVPVPDDGPALPADRPILVLLHGTMSSAMGSFGDLWSVGTDDAGQAAAAARRALKVRYGDDVYALEHRTLTESPIQNALALAERLPPGAQLDLVSHSRGGLVGELMCLAERDRKIDPLENDALGPLFAADRTVAEQLGLGRLDGAAATARDKSYADDRARLVQLVKVLDANKIKVRRFVRVACPARGTTLTSGRLDRWLSVINLLTGNGLVSEAADFLLAVVKERTDPRTLPGLEAMMPGSALTRLLQHPSLTTSADLSVIAGDVEGQGLWGQLKLLAVDWFYGSDHDLVVNTGSMVGGIRRPDGGSRFLRDQGERVTHFNYFGSAKSVGWLVNGLMREDGSDGGYTPMAAARQEEPRWRSAVRQSRAATAPRPIALVLPGTMGSALTAHGKPVWLSYWTLARGGLGELGWGAGDIEVGDVLDAFYGPLLEHLARTHRVEVFPYDWRQSVTVTAARLAERLEALLPDAERTGQSVHIVAHSLGGLVARAMIADGAAGSKAWRRATALPGSRLLMLGTPNRGSHEAFRWLVGSNATEAKLGLLDITHGANGIIDIVRQFPGMVELLPFDESSRFGQPSLWKQLRTDLNALWPLVDEAALRAAASTWALLQNAAPDPQHMVIVAGCQRATVTDYQVVDEEFEYRSARKRLDFIATAEGDGTVTWASGRLAGVPMFYAADTAHDELCSNVADRRVFRAYVELLMTGKTDQLPASPPSVARSASGEPVRFVLPLLPVTDDVPDERAVRGLSFGGGLPARYGGTAPVSSVIEVSLRHGDLAYARHAVLVGHYLGDTIVSAERALDVRLQGALTRRRDLGLYPGASGTYAVFFNEEADGKPVGALVVGLGQVGELSPGQLETGVRDALLDYALRVTNRPDLRPPENPQPQGGPRRARVSCLLVGTGAGALRIRDSIEALLRGALSANRKLEAAELDQKVLIDQLEILEVYEDVALSAARELATLLDSAVLGTSLRWSRRCIEEGEGRRQRRRFGSDVSWWQRLEIVPDARNDQLRFIATTDRARAEESLASGQLLLAESFIAQACGSAVSNADVAKTLFEMLLPNRLKESSPDQRDLVLLLDDYSARFPWEMLEDRWSHTGRPPAVAGGLLRQLKTTQFRVPAAHAVENTVFVVGNPNLDGWDTFPDLPGARREAELVARVFAEKGYATIASVDEKADAILGGLHAKPWRLVHLAGHGAHEFKTTAQDAPAGTDASVGTATPLHSGMVIGKDTFLTPGDVEQMRYVPELVFINCCYLGRTQSSRVTPYNALAANVGVQFIRMGVKAVIAAGWAVDDAAALTFAETFYRRMLGGDMFGDAVQAAREAAWSGHPGANTWGAYQCYGDPAYRLQRDPQSDPTTVPPSYFSPSELVTDLRNVAEATRMTSKESDDDDAIVQRLKAQIQRLLQRVPAEASATGCEGWLDRADVAAALGFAYGEGRQFGDAVTWLNKALGAPVGDCPIRAAEQCANFEVRLAAQEWAALQAGEGAPARRASGPRTQALRARQGAIAERIEAAIRELDSINQRATTPERLRLLGSACKRLAWVQTDPAPRIEALLNMAQYYRSAYDLAGADDSYAFSNWAVACLLLAHLEPEYERGNWRQPLADLCTRQSEATRALGEDDPSLWRTTGLADTEVVQMLLFAGDAARCGQHAERAIALYKVAFERGASLREIASIQEHFDFLLALMDGWPPTLATALDGIRRTLG
ncbi:MAG: CHAT domain-containing protein [Caldimonas sp.]